MNTSDEIAKQSLLARLAALGYEVGSLAELRNSGQRYSSAIAVLIEALGEIHDERSLKEVVRSLGVPWARPAAVAPLIALFHTCDGASDSDLRWAIGDALGATWDDAWFDDLATIAADPKYGRAREMLVLGFGRSKRREAADVLVSLLPDATVNGHAASALIKHPAPEAGPGLQALLNDRRPWARKAAAKALSKIAELSTADPARVDVDYAESLKWLHADLATRGPRAFDGTSREWSTSLDLPDWPGFAAYLAQHLEGEFIPPLGPKLVTVVENAPLDAEDFVDLATIMGFVRLGWFIGDVETVDVHLWGSDSVVALCDVWTNEQ
ncbi:HEAT repeat domain-containing protein [Microbacterium sp. NPDC089189]|uniref:HEAT repeat domain-containing protein n=1 Tax=Microbacterium sp. NPDC089189 TaxID=3154972 RepID=UPI0034310410